MCTVVYIPKDNSVFFASLRDESPLREQAIEPRINNTDAVQYLAPKDALAGGTWVGVNAVSYTHLTLPTKRIV